MDMVTLCFNNKYTCRTCTPITHVYRYVYQPICERCLQGIKAIDIYTTTLIAEVHCIHSDIFIHI